MKFLKIIYHGFVDLSGRDGPNSASHVTCGGNSPADAFRDALAEDPHEVAAAALASPDGRDLLRQRTSLTSAWQRDEREEETGMIDDRRCWVSIAFEDDAEITEDDVAALGAIIDAAESDHGVTH